MTEMTRSGRCFVSDSVAIIFAACHLETGTKELDYSQNDLHGIGKTAQASYDFFLDRRKCE